MAKEKNIKVYFCPKCKGVDVGFVFGLKNIFGIIPKMQCKKCGFSSNVFPLGIVDKNRLGNKIKIGKKKR